MAREDERATIHLRVTHEIKADLDVFARDHGVSLNAASNMLLVQALRLERLRDQADNK